MQNLLEEYERRFVAWWQSLNDSASNETNLDLKLQNHSTIRDILLRLLIILQMNLDQLQQYLSNQASDSHLDAYDSNAGELNPVKTEGTSSIPGTVEDMLQAIKDALKELGHFSAAMRESKKSSETKRALAFAAAHYDSTHFERMAFLVVETLYPDAPEVLQSQLSRSMADRNLRLNYRAFRHGKFRRYNKSSGLFGHQRDESLRRNAANAVASQPSGPGGTYPDNAVHAPGQQQKVTVPSSYNTTQFKRNLATPNQSKSRYGATTAVLSSSVPPLPDFAGKDDVQCQWCFLTIPKTFVQDGKWTSSGRKHYLADLEPYVCISEECSESLPTFSSARLWRAHMESHDTMRRRNLDHHETGASPSSVSDLHEHVEIVHNSRHGQPHAASDDEAVVNRSRPVNGCPVCGYTIDRLDMRTVTRDLPIKDDQASGASKRSGEGQTETSTKRIKISEATRSRSETQSLDYQDNQAVTAAMENHVLGHLEFLMVLSLKLGDNEDAASGSNHEDDKSKTVEVSHGVSKGEHLYEGSIEDMSSLPSGTPPDDSSSFTGLEDAESPGTDSIWSVVFAKTRSSLPLSTEEDKILENMRRQAVANLQRQVKSTGGGGTIGYVVDYVPSYRLDQKGLLRYLFAIFTSDSYRRRIKYEMMFDEGHYRVCIPRQLTKEEKSDQFLEKHRWAKGDDNPFA